MKERLGWGNSFRIQRLINRARLWALVGRNSTFFERLHALNASVASMLTMM